MRSYIKGFIKNLFRKNISVLALVDAFSNFHNTTKINRFVKVVKSDIGKYTYIGANTWVFHSKIGSFCSIADSVNIGLASHTKDFLSTSPLFTETNNALKQRWSDKDFDNPYKTTNIGNDVWIGSRVMIKSGINIGNGAIIGAGAIVTKDIPPYTIVVGVPARIISYRFSDSVIKLIEDLKWYEMDDSTLRKNIDFFQKKIDENLLNDFNKQNTV